MKDYLPFLKNIDTNVLKKLEDLIDSTNGTFKIIKPKEKLFKFPFVLYIPNVIQKNTLILHGNNLAKQEGDILNIYSAVFETTIEAGYDLLNLDQPILVPVTSNYIHPLNNNMKEFFPLQASRNVVFCEDENNIYYKLFDQINNMIDYAKEYILKETSVKLKEKIICHGFSSSAKFVLRYATCFPSKVSLLIAGGFGVQNILPLEKIKIKTGEYIDLPYPIGIYDIQKITGSEFDYENFKNMYQLYFIGENETDKNDTAFNFRNTDLDIQKIYEKVFGKGFQLRYEKMGEIIKELGYNNIEFKKYENEGHSATPAIDYTTYLINKYS